jgi:hypothetical protein
LVQGEDAVHTFTEGNKTGSFVARYAGALGDGLEVSFCPAGNDSDGGTFFSQWDYAGQFDQRTWHFTLPIVSKR